MARIPAFDAATAQQRAAGVARTSALRDNKSSDADRWRDPEMHHAAWAGRTALLAHYIHPGETVFEFGAGVRSARPFLPEGCRYVASDLAPCGPQTLGIDLNAPTLAPVEGFDVAFLSGVLEYVHSLSRLAHFFVGCFPAVVCSYAAANDRSPATLERRRYAGWFSDLSVEEFASLFLEAGYRETIRGAWSGQTLFRFDRRDGAGARS